MVSTVRFGAILHPVRLKPGSKTEKDLGPVRTEQLSLNGRLWMSSLDYFQGESAKNYVREAVNADGEKNASVHQGAGERSFAFLGNDAIGIKQVLADSAELKKLHRRIVKIKALLAENRRPRDDLSQKLVQGYVDSHAQ